MEDGLLKGLTEEQIFKAQHCKNQEEILELAKQEGIQLTEEQLEAVSGGWCSQTPPPCPFCGSKNTIYCPEDKGYAWYCLDCHSPWGS